jgi:prephenate dehydrogenase
LGLIGSSLALALSEAGWTVSGNDQSDFITEQALAARVIDGTTLDEDVTLVLIATPAGTVGAIAHEILDTLQRDDLIVSDVAGVKGTIVDAVHDPRFLAGHPMAGSEQRGLAGARSDLFRGCTWVLTPTDMTTAEAYGALHGILRELGANVVAVGPDDHDRLMAVASHVPHLLAGALMNEASRVAEQDAVLLQLAAGGFRDMTRVAAGDPEMWPDVLFENRVAISRALSSLEMRLATIRQALNSADRHALVSDLASAAMARRLLPGRALNSDNLVYLRVAVSDQPGELAAVTRAASEILVNIYDIEIAHGIEGKSGTLLLAIDALQAEQFAVVLRKRGYHVGHE